MSKLSTVLLMVEKSLIFYRYFRKETMNYINPITSISICSNSEIVINTIKMPFFSMENLGTKRAKIGNRDIEGVTRLRT